MPYFVKLLLSGFFASGATASLALGFQLITYVTRIFHFAYLGILTFSAYVSYEFANQHGMPIGWAIVLGFVTGVVITAFIELAIYRPLRRRGASLLGILIASLGTLLTLQSLEAIIWGDQPLELTSIKAITSGAFHFGSITVARADLIQLVVSAVLLGVIVAVFHFTDLGRHFRALADAPARAESFGVRTNRVIMWALLFGTVVVLPSIIIQSMYNGISPYGGEDMLLTASVAAFAGGMGSFTGTFIVSVGASTVTGMAVWVIPSQWTNVLIYALLTLVVLIRPQGILGRPFSLEGTNA